MKRLGLVMGLAMLMSIAARAAPLPMVAIDGQPMVSLTNFTGTFGTVAYYDSFRDEIDISLGVHSVVMIPYWNWAWIEGQQVPLDVAPVMIDNDVYVPVRFITSALGLPCSWVGLDQQVTIFCPGTTASFEFFLDRDWDRRPHDWRYVYPDFRFFPFNRDDVRRHGDRDRDDRDRDDRDRDHRGDLDRNRVSLPNNGVPIWQQPGNTNRPDLWNQQRNELQMQWNLQMSLRERNLRTQSGNAPPRMTWDPRGNGQRHEPARPAPPAQQPRRQQQERHDRQGEEHSN